MNSGLVTVLLPLYNQKATLRQAVESVLNQSHPALELIVIDDGSTDYPQLALRLYSDPRLHYHRLPHGGLPRALNYGLKAAKGEFITWTSGDNIMLPDMVEELVKALQARPDHAAAYAGYYHIDDQGRVLGYNAKAPYVYDPRPLLASTDPNYFVTQFCGFGAAFLYRARACQLAGGFDLQCEGIEDVDYSIRIAQTGPVIWVPKLLYKYRIHDESMSGRERLGLISYQAGRARFWQKLRQNEYGF